MIEALDNISITNMSQAWKEHLSFNWTDSDTGFLKIWISGKLFKVVDTTVCQDMKMKQINIMESCCTITLVLRSFSPIFSPLLTTVI